VLIAAAALACLAAPFLLGGGLGRLVAGFWLDCLALLAGLFAGLLGG
jgi:hypothetical protein